MISPTESKRILLTGATGFVGPAAARALLANGHIVHAAGRHKPNSTIPFASWSNLPDQTANTDWSMALREMDVVVHLAGRAHAKSQGSDARNQIWTVNVLGTQALAQQAAQAGVRRFVYLSSLKVHGDHSGDRPHQPNDPLRPDDIYGESKAEAEALLRHACSSGRMELVIVRPPLIVGPGSKANVARLIQLVRSGLPLPFASVSNRRSILSLANLSDLLVTCITHARATEQPLLAADAIAPSTPQLIRWVAEALQQPARLFRCSPRFLELAVTPFGLGPMMHRLTRSQELDSSATTALVGWRPRLTTLDSLRAMCTSQAGP